MFDVIASPSVSDPSKSKAQGELECYQSTDTEDTNDVLMWWTEKKGMFPNLSRVALDYLSTPGKY